jgi:hypothetical protein
MLATAWDDIKLDERGLTTRWMTCHCVIWLTLEAGRGPLAGPVVAGAYTRPLISSN